MGLLLRPSDLTQFLRDDCGTLDDEEEQLSVSEEEKDEDRVVSDTQGVEL